MTETLVRKRMQMTEAKALVVEVNVGIADIGEKLVDLYEREGFKSLQYDTWETFLRTEFHASISTAKRLMTDVTTRRLVAERIKVNQLASDDGAQKVAAEISAPVVRKISRAPKEHRARVIDESLDVDPGIGVTLDTFAMDEELRKSRPDGASAPSQSLVIRDGNDSEVSGEALQRIFRTTRPEFSRLRALLVEVYKGARELAQNDRDDGVYLREHISALQRATTQAGSIITHTAPYATCPTCKSWGVACESCNSVGFVTRPMWDVLSKDMTHR